MGQPLVYTGAGDVHERSIVRRLEKAEGFAAKLLLSALGLSEAAVEFVCPFRKRPGLSCGPGVLWCCCRILGAFYPRHTDSRERASEAGFAPGVFAAVFVLVVARHRAMAPGESRPWGFFFA